MLGKLLLLILLLLRVLENSISLRIRPFQRRMNPSNWATFDFHFFTPPGQWFSALLIVYPPFPGTGIPGGHCRPKHLGLIACPEAAKAGRGLGGKMITCLPLWLLETNKKSWHRRIWCSQCYRSGPWHRDSFHWRSENQNSSQFSNY